MRLVLEWDGTDEELVDLIWDLSEEGLDSRDLGDSMGWIIFETINNDSEYTVKRDNHTLYAYIDYDSFEWDRIPD